jgi:NADPH2 dehydrogenase
MKTPAFNRFSPLPIPKSKVLRNRVVVPAMASSTADSCGYVTEKTIDHYKRLGSSGAGLIFVEYTYVHYTGKSEAQQIGASSDLHVAGLRDLAQVIKDAGAVAALQLTHAGAKTERLYTRGHLMGPSEIAVPVKDRSLEIPKEMTLSEINLWKESFVSAAGRADQAGFEMIELHAAHGYGLNQWLSPITNRRVDNFGGHIQNRMGLIGEIIKEIRIFFPSLLISVRIPGQDNLDGGLSINDGVTIGKTLEALGVHIINVSSGIGGWRRPRDRSGQGYLLPEAIEIQRHVDVPVIGVGGIQSGDFIDSLVSTREVTLVAVGRAILESPKKWQEENLSQSLAIEIAV